MGGVEPWWMARWKARAEFLLNVIELLFLSLTVEALQGKMCQNSLPSGVGRSLGAKISGARGRPWGTRHILLSNSTIPACDGQTDGRTDGIAVACNASIAARCKNSSKSPYTWHL